MAVSVDNISSNYLGKGCSSFINKGLSYLQMRETCGRLNLLSCYLVKCLLTL